MITLDKVCKSYPLEDDKVVALSDVSLSFPDVQFVSVLGPSGCGKTTLLNVIGALDEYDSGNLIYDGKELGKLSQKDKDKYRNNEVGFVFQNYYLIPQLTVLENVKMALSISSFPDKEATEKALKALAEVGCLDLKNKKPNQLSGGQAQRIAIARALVSSPSIILADEPTGALDSESSAVIMNLLKKISQDRLVIMVTHNEDLANEYSDRIIRMKDGRVIEDSLPDCMGGFRPYSEERKPRLSFLMSLKLAFKNLFSRMWKTILTAIANSFGMIGIAFLLAINNGFDKYSSNLSSASATSLPIVVSTYNRKNSSQSFADANASTPYPDTDEIYPSVTTESEYSYVYNTFTQKYLSYLDSMVNEGLIREYLTSYSNSYSFNLSTEFPDSLNGKNSGGIEKVTTTITNYNYYAYNASLPYNIFHVLYGDLSQYDLIAGELPTNDTDLVLVVDKYNAVSFSILQALGFYNSEDTEESVKDKTLSTKVKPISFADVIGKEYKIFTNDEIYKEKVDLDDKPIKDSLGNDRELSLFEEQKITDEFYESNGRTLKITGVIRLKKTSSLSILSPSLCYSKQLQAELMPENESSPISTKIKNNIVFKADDSIEDPMTSFLSEISDVLVEFLDDGGSILPTSKINDILSKYFRFYSQTMRNGYYTGFTTFLRNARNLGSDLVLDEMRGIDYSKEENLNAFMESVQDAVAGLNYDRAYDLVISFAAYINAYSSIQALVIFPTDLSTRQTVMNRLDEYNNIKNDDNHASSTSEQIYYSTSDANDMISEVEEMISLVSIILIMFSVISLVASSAMTALLVSNNVLERRKEIGLLRALGTRKGDVVSLFELESLFVGLTAGIIGSLFTFVLCFPLNKILNVYLAYYNIGTICNFTFIHALIVTGVSILIGVVASLIPSYKAGKVSPVTSLRSE